MQNCPYTSPDADAGPIPAGATMVARYHDDALAPGEHVEFAAHLAQCPVCMAELRQLSAIRQALQAMTMPTASQQFVGALQEQWDCIPQLTVRRFVGRLTKVAAVVAVVAMGHLMYEVVARPAASMAAARPAAPSAWEQVAIAADSANAASAAEQPNVSGGAQFAEFVVHDLGARGSGEAVGGGGRP